MRNTTHGDSHHRGPHVPCAPHAHTGGQPRAHGGHGKNPMRLQWVVVCQNAQLAEFVPTTTCDNSHTHGVWTCCASPTRARGQPGVHFGHMRRPVPMPCAKIFTKFCTQAIHSNTHIVLKIDRCSFFGIKLLVAPKSTPHGLLIAPPQASWVQL